VIFLTKVEVKEKYYLSMHPRPAYIIGSGVYGLRANLMAASWITPVSEEPPRVALALDMESYTWKLIKETGEFSINILTEEYLEKLYYVGSRSGRNVDKIKSIGLRVTKGDKINAPIIEDAVSVLECKVFKVIECGDTNLIIADVLKCMVDEEKFNIRYGWDMRKTRIPLHLWGRVFTFPRGIKIVGR